MNKTEIKNIIKSVNQNNDIKWIVEKSTKEEVRISNNYLDKTSFTIKVDIEQFDDEQDVWVKAIDEQEEQSIEMYMVGESRYTDFQSIDKAMAQLVKDIVHHFYYCY